jgi:hypothetical protein
MSRRPALDVDNLINPDDYATYVAELWTTWDTLRSEWLKEKLELRN